MRYLIWSLGVIATAGASPMDTTAGVVDLGTQCNDLFGRPTPSDCTTAVEGLTSSTDILAIPGAINPLVMRFLHHPSCPARPDIPNQLLPITAAHGDCVVTVNYAPSLMGAPQTSWWDEANWEDLRAIGRLIIDHCVSDQRSPTGGLALTGRYERLALSILGPNSQMDERYRELLLLAKLPPAKPDNVEDGVPTGDRESATTFDSKVCFNMPGYDVNYADDQVQFKNPLRLLVAYGISNMWPVSLCT